MGANNKNFRDVIFSILNEYGGISTYFKPENGMAYWLEQIEKYALKNEI